MTQDVEKEEKEEVVESRNDSLSGKDIFFMIIPMFIFGFVCVVGLLSLIAYHEYLDYKNTPDVEIHGNTVIVRNFKQDKE